MLCVLALCFLTFVKFFDVNNVSVLFVMAYKYREDLVGKRFLSVSGVTKINVNKVSEWGWKAGVIRAASLKDNKNKELQVKLYRLTCKILAI